MILFIETFIKDNPITSLLIFFIWLMRLATKNTEIVTEGNVTTIRKRDANVKEKRR